MFVHLQPADTPSGMAPENPDPAAVKVPHVERPLSVVTVPDRSMQPELHPGQQVLVQNFDARSGANYLEQRMAWRLHSPTSNPRGDSQKRACHEGRVLVRRGQIIPGGGIRLFGNAHGYELTLHMPDGWELPADWKTTGVVHPACTCLGPLITAYRNRQGGRDTYLATVGWSN